MTVPPTDADARPSHAGRWVAASLGLLVLLLLGGYAAAVYAVSGEDVPTGTTVRGVDIGGMTTEQAVATLTEQLGEVAAELIPVTAGDASMQIEPAQAGLSVDWEATVESASGLVLAPGDLLDRLRGKVDVEPITRTDEAALAASLADLAEVAAAEPVEPSIEYSKKAVVIYTPGVPGTALDVPAAADAISATYLATPYDTLALPMTAVPPSVADEEARRVVDELAEPAVALPVALRVAQRTAEGSTEEPEVDEVTVTPADLARALTFAPEGATLVPSLDGAALHKRLADDLEGIERRGRDARIVIKSGAPVVVSSKTGRSVDDDELSTAVLAVLPATDPAARVAEVTLAVSQPDFTTAEAKALGITEKLSSFRQWFPPAAYRYQNVGQAAEYLNGTIIEPGETFSMNDTIKERTPANGYTKGFIISGGRFREELGGGVSIITTATWTAGFYAGLERVEQHPHGLYISRYQAGLEATVAWGLLDLKMRNDTGNGVLITATRYSDGVLIEMWGTKKFDKVTASFSERYNYTPFTKIVDDSDRCVPSEGVRGFSISVTRRRIIDGKVVSTETWPTTYKPTPNVVCTSPDASQG